MGSVYGVSIIAAFIAGLAALFAPCCITVLFPSYFASIFKERYKVFLMTFIFFLGVLTVFLPIGLGAGALAQVFNRYHNLIFSLGGVMLTGLGLSMLFGKSLMMPFGVEMPKAEKYNAGAIYLLGVFSAIATTCCAPVLAGVLALAVASGTIFWGSIYTLAYVLGMVLPLFIIALFLDKIDFTNRFKTLRSRKEIRIKSFTWKFSIAELISGIVFLAMGVYIMYLAFTGNLAMRSDYQLKINLMMAGLNSSLKNTLGFVPGIVVALLITAIFIAFIAFAIKQNKRKHDKQN